LRVTVLEARPRVGGRILTLHDARSPVPIELGAEFIHAGQPRRFRSRGGRARGDRLPGTTKLAVAGRFKPMGDFWDVVDRMNHDLARRLASRGKDFSRERVSRLRARPGGAARVLRDFVQGFYAAHPDRLSAKSLAVETERGRDAPTRKTRSRANSSESPTAATR